MSETKRALEDVSKMLTAAGWDRGVPASKSTEPRLPEERGSWTRFFALATTTAVLLMAALLVLSFFFRAFP